jgi:ankyrin repeat protein
MMKPPSSLDQRQYDVINRFLDDESNLYMAASFGEHRIVELLVKLGCNVNTAYGDRHWTALHVASRMKAHKVVEILLKAGADVNTICQNGSTPLRLALNIGGIRELCGNKASMTAANERI